MTIISKAILFQPEMTEVLTKAVMKEELVFEAGGLR